MIYAFYVFLFEPFFEWITFFVTVVTLCNHWVHLKYTPRIVGLSLL